MGIVHKLTTENKELVLTKIKQNPALSCRRLSLLIKKDLSLEVSKSSINALIKEAGLSMPVGRRSTRPKFKLNLQILPEQIQALTAPVAEPQKTEPEKPKEEPAVVEPKTPEVINLEPPEQLKLEPPKEPEAVAKTAEEKEIEGPIAAEEKTESPKEIKEEVIAKVPAEPLEPAGNICNGSLILKAADYLLGGSFLISEAIKKRLNVLQEDIQLKTEALVFGQNAQQEELWALIGRRLNQQEVLSFLDLLEGGKTIGLDILRVIPQALQEARCLRIYFQDTSSIYIDGLYHTAWSTPNIPYDFSTPLYTAKKYVNKYFFENKPLCLLMSPGFDAPTREFFNFVAAFNAEKKRVTRVGLYGNNFEELDSVSIEQNKKICLVFGLWPWQFTQNRRVKALGDFKPFFAEALQKELFIAPIELELIEPSSGQVLSFYGFSLKNSVDEKTRQVVLCNCAEVASTQGIAQSYLSRWPNFEEAFQDHSRKIELFTYTADSKSFFSVDKVDLGQSALSQGIKHLFSAYVSALDLYAKCHIFPAGYLDLPMSVMQERFYGLEVQLRHEKNCVFAAFKLPSGFQFRGDLEYALRRLNEREVEFKEGLRLYFLIS